MKFQVIQEDINNGIKCSPRQCPIAQCIKRTYPDRLINIGTDDVSIAEGRYEKGTLTELPLIARQFIDNFDKGLEVSPFEFELDI